MTNMNKAAAAILAITITAWGFKKTQQRIQLSMAKQSGLVGHLRWSKRISKLIPGYAYGPNGWLNSDGADDDIRDKRHASADALSKTLKTKCKVSLLQTHQTKEHISDLQLINQYRVPFPYVNQTSSLFPISSYWQSSNGSFVEDLDGNTYFDATGSYGVNLFGNDFYKSMMRDAVDLAEPLGAVLGSYHPTVADNVNRLCKLSSKDQVSFHMSGTEAVMQAVRMARYISKRNKLVRFSGAYHGWWDDVQPGPGNPMPVSSHTLTLKEYSKQTLNVISSRNDIACVLVNPLQALHINQSSPADSSLIATRELPGFDRAIHTQWLKDLRMACTRNGVALIFDEVFMGFRLGIGGAQEYFNVQADLVTYGKTLGGGFPVGVVCGNAPWMKRFREERPADLCFARGTFNAHPYVMVAMNQFLKALDEPEMAQKIRESSCVWSERLTQFNESMQSKGFPIQMIGMETVWSLQHTCASRYNWMLQFFLREAGIALSWTGTGRFIFNHAVSDHDFEWFLERFIQACEKMQSGGWWWHPEGQTSKLIRRRFLMETLKFKLGLTHLGHES